jgi:hypothetical protein
MENWSSGSSATVGGSAASAAILKSDGGWSQVPIARIEDLQDAVLGASLDAIQMSLGADPR